MHIKFLFTTFLFSVFCFGISATSSFATNNCGVGHASIGEAVSFSPSNPTTGQSVTATVTANNAQRVDVDVYGPGGGSAIAGQNGGICGGTTCTYTFPTNSGAGTYSVKFNAWDTCSGAVANHWVTGTVTAANSAPPPSNSAIKGYTDIATSTLFSGWVCQTQHTNEAVDVHFYLDGPYTSGQYLGAIYANKPREQAVGDQCEGNVNHGFSIDPHTLTNSSLLFDGKSHQIYEYAIGIGGIGNPLLSGSPILMVGPTTGSVTLHFQGIDSLNNTKPHHLQRSLSLYFYSTNSYGVDPQGKKADFSATDILTFSSGSTGTNDPLSDVFTNTTFNLSTVPTGDYYVLVKSSEGSLRQLLSNQKIHINAGTNNIIVSIDTTNGTPTIPTLQMGDINNDNAIDINDYAILRDCYGNYATQSRCTNHNLSDTTAGLFADMNDDGIVDGIDYNLLIRNMNANGL